MPPTRIQMLASIKNGIQTATSRMVPLTRPYPQKAPLISTHRQFTTSTLLSNWLLGKRKLRFKDPTGSPRVPTGGSIRGTTVIWGDYGLRMRDHHRRISAAQLKNGEDVIRRRLRGMAFRLYTRMHAGTAVYKKGNESRMGTGKGKFDHWACRVPVSRLIFELKGDIHEQVIRDAMRLAANKMPGLYEFVKKGDPPVMGITKLKDGVTAADLLRPRRKVPLQQTPHPIQEMATATSAIDV